MIWFVSLLGPAALAWFAYALVLSVRSRAAINTAADIERIEEGFVEPEPEEWPRRQTPTDLAAAYEPVTAHRAVEWDHEAFERLHQDFLDDQRRYQWARAKVDEFVVDVRDRLVSV